MKRDFRPARPLRSSSSRSKLSLFSGRRRPATSRSSQVKTQAHSPRRESQFGSFVKKVLNALLVSLIAGALLVGVVGVSGYFFLQQRLKLKDELSILFLPATTEVAQQPALWLQLSPATHSVVAVTIDAQIPVSISGGYGEYKVGSLYPLLSIDRRSPAEQQALISLAMGRIVSKPIPWSSPPSIKSKQELQQLLSSFINQSSPDLSRQEAVKMVTFVQSVPDMNMVFEKVSTPAELEKQLEVMPALLKDKSCPIAVVNGTKASGLASKVSQVIEQSGGVVINVNDSPVELAQTEIAVNPSAGQDCLKIGESLHLLLPQVDSVAKNAQLTQQYRAEIVIMIGTESESLLQ